MQNKLKIINDPVHGFIQVNHDVIYQVIEHPYFQRLRRISQTGLLSLVYPGATHTRFQHALGAMHLVGSAVQVLREKGVSISQEEEHSVLIAVLLHDLGHGPFSHALESVLMKDCHHEKISLSLMKEINKDLSGKLDLAIEMFQGKYHRNFFNQLISSQLDVDRLDYLKRDSFYTGVSEGNVNAQRIISMMNICDEQLVVETKGIYSVENFLTARMFMYRQVYFHKSAIVAEYLLVKIMERAKQVFSESSDLLVTPHLRYFLEKDRKSEMELEDLHRFSKLDDTDILFGIKHWQEHKDPVLSYLCRLVILREFPKSKVVQESVSPDVIEQIKQIAREKLPEKVVEVLVVEIERTLLAYDSRNSPIYLLQKNGTKLKLEDSKNQLLTNYIKDYNSQKLFVFPREIAAEAFRLLDGL